MSDTDNATIAFIPDFSVFGQSTTAKLFDIVKNEDFPISAVCLPVIQMGGLPFASKIGSYEEIKTIKVAKTPPTPITFDQVVTQMLGAGHDIYFFVNPSMEFLNVPPAHVVDIRSVGSPSACFNKKITQNVIVDAVVAAFKTIQAAADQNPVDWSKFKGVAIDITDLWGMGGSAGHIHPTCFCGDCRAFFEGKGLAIADFETAPNPFQLALRSSNTGISYIDNFSPDEPAASIVGKSKLREFDTDFASEGAKLNAAEHLHRYMKLRHQMVQECLDKVFTGIEDKLAEAGIDLPKDDDGKLLLRRIIVAEGVEYSWTGGVFLNQISSGAVDEVWFDPTEKTTNLPDNVTYRYFTSIRATYFLNAFIQLIANVKDPVMLATTGLGRLSEKALRDRIEQRGLTAVGRMLDNLYQLSLAAQNDAFRGFVRPTINSDIAKQLAATATVAASPHAKNDDPDDGGKAELMELFRQMQAARGPGGN